MSQKESDAVIYLLFTIVFRGHFVARTSSVVIGPQSNLVVFMKTNSVLSTGNCGYL